MIIQSKLNDKKYIWVKIPRTATVSYNNIFNPIEHRKNYIHAHLEFITEYRWMNQLCSGFSVVRNPLSRFVSSLKYIYESKTECGCDNCKKFNYDIPLDTISNLCDFLNKNFQRNCYSEKTTEEIFNVKELGFINSFFKTQAYWAYHPKVKIFKFEALNEFNQWIEKELGYDTSSVSKDNSTKNNTLEHLDFTDSYFINTVQNLFYDDYILFDYPFLA